MITEQDIAERRLKLCVERWPECESGLYDPNCCRFPKSCSPHGRIEQVAAGNLTEDDLELKRRVISSKPTVVEHIDVLEGAFVNHEGNVIGYQGENFYRACGAFVNDLPEGGTAFCVKRVGHPGRMHESYYGATRYEITGEAMRMFTVYRTEARDLKDDIEKHNYLEGDQPQFEGVQFSDGKVVQRWLTPARSMVMWDSWEDLCRVHIYAHPDYGTRVEWYDGEIQTL